MKIRQLTLLEAEFIAHELAKRIMNYDEPMPDFYTRYPGKLESCLTQPFQTFSGRYLYYRLTHRAAVLFYLVTKNHPFANGNKRMAVTLTLAFLFINNKWINVPPKALYDVACKVAESSPSEQDDVISALTSFFNKFVVKA